MCRVYTKGPRFPFTKIHNLSANVGRRYQRGSPRKSQNPSFRFFPVSLSYCSMLILYSVVSQDSRTSLQRALTKTSLKKTLSDQLTQRIIETSKASSTHPGHRQTPSGTEIPSSLRCLFEGPDTSQEKIETPDLSSASSEASVPESRNSVHSIRSPPHQIGGLQSAQSTDVYDSKDLQRRLSLLTKAFVGKETDLNWDFRDRELHNFRQLLRGNAAVDHVEQLLICLKEFMESLNRTLLSLRTTLAISALSTVADLSQYLPDGSLDPYCFLVFPSLLKCASSTKKLLAEAAHSTVLTYLDHSSYNLKTLSLICSSLSDRSAQLRVYGVSYLIAFLNRHSIKPQQFEKRGLQVGLELVIAGVTRSLSDANPKARELARQAFSLIRDTWPTQAQDMLKSLDASTRKQFTQDAPKPINMTGSVPSLRPPTRMAPTRTRASEAPSAPANRPASSLRNLRTPKPSSLRGDPVSRPSSVMVTSTDRKALRRGVGSANPSFHRSPSAFGAPIPREDSFYTPPRDLNTGKLATDPGVSRIPRPPISTNPRPTSVATVRPSSVASNPRPARSSVRSTPRSRPLSLLSPPTSSRSHIMTKASSEGSEITSPRSKVKKDPPTSQVYSSRLN